MSEFLFQYYPVHPTTWVYLSSLLMIGVYFKFSRFWSVRNVDLVLLILLAPGLLMVHFGEQRAPLEQGTKEVAATVDEVTSADVDLKADPGAAEGDAAADRDTTGQIEENGSPRNAAAGIDSEEANGTNPAPKTIPETAVPATEVAAVEGASAQQMASLSGNSIMLIGYIWLLSVLGIFLLRLLLDPTMVRRPLLEPNLSTGGMAFIGCSLFVFLMANVINSPVAEVDKTGARSADQLLSGVADADLATDLQRHGPGNAILHSIPSFVTTPLYWQDVQSPKARYERTAKAMAIMSHLAIVVGIVAIGYQHFSSMKTGIGAATLYLMLPYTAMMTGKVDHVLPAALLVWAVLSYRRPLAAGSFIGLAIGVAYYPIFLLPLWLSFYWQRGLMRFVAGSVLTVGASVLSLLLVSDGDFLANVQTMFGIWWPKSVDLLGIWSLGWEPIYRFPVIAAFVAISAGFALWPAQKNLGTLLSCSAVVLVGTQFWHGYGGGTYMAWFLPLTLLTIFRPNLEDRVALSVLGESWFRRRGPQLRRVDRAA
ncbi:MAG: glycosyltransferase family 87 protein [Planctomycetota bacterium]|nr:glycosyltransferase family 87 protein [Planctomycetota bacterium]